MHRPRGGNQAGRPHTVVVTPGIGHDTSRLLNQQDPGEAVECVFAKLPERIEPATREIRKLQGSRSQITHGADLREDRRRGVASTLHSAVTGVLDKRLKRKSKKSALLALDVLAITRGLSDSAGERGKNNPDDLEKRIQRAVLGFLDLSFNPP